MIRKVRDYFRANSMISARNEGLLYWLMWWLRTRAYYAARGLQRLLERFSRQMAWEMHYRLQQPHCTTCGATEHVVPCFEDDNYTGIPDEYLCHDHIGAQYYCYSCGRWTFEIADGDRYHGLCETCHADIGDDDWDDRFDDFDEWDVYDSAEVEDWLDFDED